MSYGHAFNRIVVRLSFVLVFLVTCAPCGSIASRVTISCGGARIVNR